MNTNNLKVGDEVAITRYTGWTTNYSFAKVAKKTPSGVVELDNGRRFGPNGSEQKSKTIQFPSHDLADVESARANIAARETQSTNDKRVGDLLDAIKGRRTGNGHYHWTAEQLAMGDALAKSLTVASEDD